MHIHFTKITVGQTYSRHALAVLWNYKSFHAIARGVVTPKHDNKIILFVTEEKQASSEQYTDTLKGDFLDWEGPKDHFAESRMLGAASSGDQIHVFHRSIHHTDFTYLGQVDVIENKLRVGHLSYFKL